MNGKNLFRHFVLQFFVCYACTMLVSVPFCKLLTQPPIKEIPVDYLWQAAVFSLCAILTGLVYYSRRELNRRELTARTALHTILLEIVLMAAGYGFGMYRGWLGGVVFFLTILVVNVMVRLITYLDDRGTAQVINNMLQDRRKKR